MWGIRKSAKPETQLQTNRLQCFGLGCQQHPVAEQPTACSQRFLCLSPGYFRMIVLLREMRQNYKRCTIIIVVSKEIRESYVGKMPDPAHDALLDRPRVRSHTQHLQIVVRLHHQHVAPAQVIAYAQRDVPEIGGDSNLDAFCTKREPHRISGIVRNREWLHRDIAYLKCVSRLETLESFQPRFHPVFIAHGASPRLVRRSRHENWNAQP